MNRTRDSRHQHSGPYQGDDSRMAWWFGSTFRLDDDDLDEDADDEDEFDDEDGGGDDEDDEDDEEDDEDVPETWQVQSRFRPVQVLA